MKTAMIRKDVKRNTYLCRARKYRKTACERCGSKVDMNIHHKDRNYRNNMPANLETLCEDCHGKEHGEERGRIFSSRRWVSRTHMEDIIQTCLHVFDHLQQEKSEAAQRLCQRLESILKKEGRL